MKYYYNLNLYNICIIILFVLVMEKLISEFSAPVLVSHDLILII